MEKSYICCLDLRLRPLGGTCGYPQEHSCEGSRCCRDSRFSRSSIREFVPCLIVHKYSFIHDHCLMPYIWAVMLAFQRRLKLGLCGPADPSDRWITGAAIKRHYDDSGVLQGCNDSSLSTINTLHCHCPLLSFHNMNHRMSELYASLWPPLSPRPWR